MKNLRYKIERKLDRYNHLMELIRTLTGVTVLILQLILLLSLGSCSVIKRTEPCKQCPQYTNYKYPINDVKLSPEYLHELKTNLTKVGIWVENDTIK